MVPAEWIVLFRNPSTRGLIFLEDDDHNIARYGSEDDAADAANEHPLSRAWPFQIVEIGI